MPYYTDVWKIINKSNLSTKRNKNITMVRDNRCFKGLPISKQEEANAMIVNECKRAFTNKMGNVTTIDSVKQKVADSVKPLLLESTVDREGLLERARDMMPGYGVGGGLANVGASGGMFARGGVSNSMTQVGVQGSDPMKSKKIAPNLWISPYEANAIYSQKGIPELIINKKSKSILLNGVRITNPRLDAAKLEKIKEELVKLEFADHIARAVNWSLVYGGSLIFPMFKRDSPVTMNMSIAQLLKYGVIKKNCIDRFVTLDRWNVIHIPQWNPTAADYLRPSKYFIPFLGCDVQGHRCGRVVTAPQAGYIGNIMTMGWGLSDMVGWYESVLNYMSVIDVIPTMINQMSILARTINIDGVLATEGALIIDEIAKQDTVRIRNSSDVNDPINMDVIGTLQAIERDFSEVPALVRLLRQDFCAKATVPEELILSSERGAFSSGSDTEGALEKQWESIKYIHKDVASQLRYVVNIVIMSTLGLDRDVLKALPYTTVEFDNPALSDAGKKAEFFKNITEGFFNEVSGLVPAHIALKIASIVGETDLPISNELIQELELRQVKLDKQADEKHTKEMKLLDAQTKATTMKSTESGSGGAGHSYGDRLTQRKHEKVSPNKKDSQRLAKKTNT